MAVLKSVLPGSLPFLMIGLTCALGLLYWPRGARWGRRCLAALVLSYLVFSLPVGVSALAKLLSAGYAPIASREAARDATAVVVLDGGAARFSAWGGAIRTVNRPSAFRTLEAVRVFRLINPALVVVAGAAPEPGAGSVPSGQMIVDELIRAGIPADRLWLDSTSRNTRDHAVILSRILRERGVRRFVLVTSPTHMRRAMLAFRAMGADPVPSISALGADAATGWDEIIPSFSALEVSEEVVHDALSLIYYWARGWL